MESLGRGEGVGGAARAAPQSGWAASFIGTPWKPFGRDRAGVDCWGLVVLVYREVFGIELPLYDGRSWTCKRDAAREYVASLRAEIGAFMASESLAWRRVPKEEERAGDVLLLLMAGQPCHVGVVVAPGFMLHAFDGADAVVETYRSFAWERRIAGLYRHERIAAHG